MSGEGRRRTPGICMAGAVGLHNEQRTGQAYFAQRRRCEEALQISVFPGMYG